MKYFILFCVIKGFVVVFVLFILFSFVQVVLLQQLLFDDNEIEVIIVFINVIEVDIKVEFDNVVGLNVSNIDISVEFLLFIDLFIVNCLLLLFVIVISGFLVVIFILLKLDVGFVFEGMVMVEIYIKVLYFNLVLCIFCLYVNGEFEDIIQFIVVGSICFCGNIGSFFDFMILMDLCIFENVIDMKFVWIEQFIVDYFL